MYTGSPKNKPRYCSKKCSKEGKIRTVQSRYGVNNVSELQAVKNKISASNSSETVKNKRKETCIAAWGVDNVAQNAEVRKRCQK